MKCLKDLPRSTSRRTSDHDRMVVIPLLMGIEPQTLCYGGPWEGHR